jgi:DNA-binding response OmpR family regulator
MVHENGMNSGGYRRCLVVEESVQTAEFVASTLQSVGYVVDRCTSKNDVAEQLRDSNPDVVIVDSSFPNIRGMAPSAAVRSLTDAYLVVFSQQEDDLERVDALEAGADDYVTARVSMRELAVRMQALMRRPRNVASRRGDSSGVRMDADTATFRAPNGNITLTQLEFNITKTLLGHTGDVVTRKEVCETVWGNADEANDHALDVHISNVRRKLRTLPGGSPLHIEGVRGVGFRVRVDLTGK